MAVETFAFSDLLQGRCGYVSIHNETINTLIPRKILVKGEDKIHARGDLRFYSNLKGACKNQNLSSVHMHYSVSPSTGIPDDADIIVVQSIHSLMKELDHIRNIADPPVIIMLTSDIYSAPFLEYIRNQLPLFLQNGAFPRSVIFSNLSILEQTASVRISTD